MARSLIDDASFSSIGARRPRSDADRRQRVKLGASLALLVISFAMLGWYYSPGSGPAPIVPTAAETEALNKQNRELKAKIDSGQVDIQGS